ncbi:hypothetical protein JHK84_043304 [Glycine max]|nr:hypothetical protein JHK84_043304 [Glycine max]
MQQQITLTKPSRLEKEGVLSDGTIVAVKQLSTRSMQGNREFINEIGLIFALQNPYLVKLYGCYMEEDQLLLIYEYMENNGLSRALFDWIGKQCRGFVLVLLKIVHTNIKATNVLLDKDLNPEISDFGLAKLDDGDKTHLSTRIASTLLLSHFQRSKALKWSFPLLSIKDFNIKEAMVMINVALLCTKVSPALRPTMSSVVSMREGRTIIQEVVSDTREVLDDKKYEIMRQYCQNRGENNLIDS